MRNLFEFIEQANAEAFPVTSHTDAEQILMRKVLINCMINPLTAILQVKNGDLLTNPHCLTLFKGLYDRTNGCISGNEEDSSL